jgi:hypothetical protein
MNIITATLGAVRAAFDKANTPVATSDERYLAEAQDMNDLERRMRELDEHRSPIYAGSFLGIYPAGSGR